MKHIKIRYKRTGEHKGCSHKWECLDEELKHFKCINCGEEISTR